MRESSVETPTSLVVVGDIADHVVHTFRPTFLAYFALDTRSDANELIGTMNGLFQAGGLLGTLSCIWTADKFGRRWALFINAVICVIGGALQAGSVSLSMFIVFRALTGWGTGALVTLVPLYQSEISPPRIRGLLVGMHVSQVVKIDT